MRYEVLKDFADLQDNKHLYRAGDEFPRSGIKASDERVAELASTHNRCRVALIRAIEEPQKPEIEPVSDKTETFDEDIKAKEKAPKRRKKKE